VPWTRVEREVYAAICAEPGLHPREYVQRVPSGYWEVTAAARRLLAAGLVRRTGLCDHGFERRFKGRLKGP